MGKYCVAAACSNTNRGGSAFLKFPNDPNLRELWSKEVIRTRDHCMERSMELQCFV